MKESRLEWKLKKTCIVAIIMLVLGAGLASSGVCLSEGFELTQQNLEEEPDEKKLTTKNLGLLMLSALFMKDKQQRQFIFKVVKELQKNGELTVNEIQIIADNLFDTSPRVFLFADVYVYFTGIVLPLPGIVSSFTSRDPIFSFLILQYGYTTINSEDYWISKVALFGFYGEAYNHRAERSPHPWYYRIDGTCVMALVL